MKRRWQPFTDLMMQVIIDGVGSVTMEEIAKTPIGDMARRAVDDWAKQRTERDAAERAREGRTFLPAQYID